MANSRHPLPVLAHRGEHDSALRVEVKLVVARGNEDADGQALDVPLPRTGQGLVEVVDVEDEAALGRCVEAEVREVGVAATLHIEPGFAVWRRGRTP